MGAGRSAGGESDCQADAGRLGRRTQKTGADAHSHISGQRVARYADVLLHIQGKPDQIRIDFIRPHPGMVMIYPDKEGRVFIRPSGLARLFRMHVRPDSRLLRVSAGQRIDQRTWGCS